MNEEVFPEIDRSAHRIYRRAGQAVAAAYLDFPPGRVDALLHDRVDVQRDTPSRFDRERLRDDDYGNYLETLVRECLVHFAGRAAEGLAEDPEEEGVYASGGDSFALGCVVELVERLESPDASEEADQRMMRIRQQLAAYYKLVAAELVRGPLLSPVLTVTEALQRGGAVDAEWVRERVIAAQS